MGRDDCKGFDSVVAVIKGMSVCDLGLMCESVCVSSFVCLSMHTP